MVCSWRETVWLRCLNSPSTHMSVWTATQHTLVTQWFSLITSLTAFRLTTCWFGRHSWASGSTNRQRWTKPMFDDQHSGAGRIISYQRTFVLDQDLAPKTQTTTPERDDLCLKVERRAIIIDESHATRWDGRQRRTTENCGQPITKT